MLKHRTQRAETAGNTVHRTLSVVYPHDHRARSELWLGCRRPESQESAILRIASIGTVQTSRLQVCFLMNIYHFRMITKSKTCKSNIVKSGSMYSSWDTDSWKWDIGELLLQIGNLISYFGMLLYIIRLACNN